MNDDITIVERPLPAGVCGYYVDSQRLIVLHDKLNARQRHCTLTHELVHAAHHDTPGRKVFTERAERRARRETAKQLISEDAYITAEQLYAGNKWPMAACLNVTMQVLEDYQQLIIGAT